VDSVAIEDRNLTVGTKLWARYKGTVHTAEVIEDLLQPEGEAAIRYRLSDGQTFKSPSAAGTAITGKSCNGWAFWTVGEPPAAKAKEPEPAKKATRTRRQKDVPRDEGGHALPIVEQVDGSFECGNCGASFGSSEEAKAHLDAAHPSEVTAEATDEAPAVDVSAEQPA
jgi:hypothetical protein